MERIVDEDALDKMEATCPGCGVPFTFKEFIDGDFYCPKCQFYSEATKNIALKMKELFTDTIH